MRTILMTGLALLASCGTPALVEMAAEKVEPGEIEAAGSATSFDFSDRAYVQPVRGLPEDVRTSYLAGQALFEVEWTVARGGTNDRDGLGPTYNATSCQACHLRNGRGSPPIESGDVLRTALLRVSVPGGSAQSGPLPHPIYGDQIQPRGISGVPGEGEVRLFYEEIFGAYDDGTPYSLLRPRLQLEPALQDPGRELLTSVRVAPATFGLGFLELIPEGALLAQADPDDGNGDGISGRPGWVRELPSGARALGRFGWKAGQPSLMQQNAAAFLGDLGITSPLRSDENCPPAQPACQSAITGGAPEIDAPRMDALLVFVRALSVPARRDADGAEVLRGKRLFHALRCAACHTPTFTTATVADFPSLSAQKIWPYSDLLLHDLGSELSDGRAEFEANGQEWRTPPLWGLGLLEKVSGHQRLLHDGRARGVAEAILWHGGEAAPSAQGFRALSTAERSALLAFLQSL